MTFSSFTFLILFLVVLSLYYTGLSWKIKKVIIVIASTIFYGAWNPLFVLLLWYSIIVDFFLAKKIFFTQNNTKRKIFLSITIVNSLAILAYFKYANFLIKSAVYLLGLCNITFNPPVLDIILPVGISFYTFQTMSYTIDIYKRKLGICNSLLDYALYVSFFPQLVAGPIIRASDFIHQVSDEKKATVDNIAWGLFLLIIGLFEKSVVADGIFAPIVEKMFSSSLAPATLSAWCGILAYSGQIFCDFAGYSSCAIGTALCLGFVFPVNFKYPYASIDFSDFWRRWHISLSSWLKDYLYIGLGGNRKGNTRTNINLMLTMLIGGLWHGASWTFVVWGGLHGIFLVIEKALVRMFSRFSIFSSKLMKLFLGIVTFGCVCITWVFFRSKTFSQAWQLLRSLFGINNNLMNSFSFDMLSIILSFSTMFILLVIHWFTRNRDLKVLVEKQPVVIRMILIIFMVLMMFVSSGEDRAFIYFQF